MQRPKFGQNYLLYSSLTYNIRSTTLHREKPKIYTLGSSMDINDYKWYSIYFVLCESMLKYNIPIPCNQDQSFVHTTNTFSLLVEMVKVSVKLTTEK